MGEISAKGAPVLGSQKSVGRGPCQPREASPQLSRPEGRGRRKDFPMSGFPLNLDSRLTAWAKGILDGDHAKLRLVDVGASGGISQLWRQWAPQLWAVGFDPLTSEVDRLNAAETDPQVRYRAAWVGEGVVHSAPDYADTLPGKVYELSSAYRGLDRLGVDYRSGFFNGGRPVEYATERTSLDIWRRAEGVNDIDFIKIDVDGADLRVLEGADETLRASGVLGVEVEAMLHGSAGADSLAFAHIDIFLQSRGFLPFSLFMPRYTRGALPGRFDYHLIASTLSGQVRWLDALYFLDPAVTPEVLGRFPADQRCAKLIKLMTLYDMYGLPDCAAQLAVEFQRDYPQLGTALDLLTPVNPYGARTHSECLAIFDEDPTRFYPSHWRDAEKRGAWTKTLPLSLEFAPLSGEVAPGDVGVRIVTPPVAWGYAASLSIPVLNPKEAACVVDITVESGAVVLTLADDALQSVGEQRIIEADGRQVTVLLCDPHRARLLVRSADSTMPATAVVHAVKAMG